MRFSGVILAGGRSSRMGRDKAWIEQGGAALLARQLQLLEGLEPREVLISGRPGVDYSMFGHRVLVDRETDRGPLAGVERALDAIGTALLLVLAVDMPRMATGYLRTLLTRSTKGCGCVPRKGGRFESLAACYPKTCHALAERALLQGDSSMQSFVRACVRADRVEILEVSEPDRIFFENWNRPEDVVP